MNPFVMRGPWEQGEQGEEDPGVGREDRQKELFTKPL